MFEHPVVIMVRAIKDLEASLKANQKTNHLSEVNVVEMQRTISYLSKNIEAFYEKGN